MGKRSPLRLGTDDDDAINAMLRMCDGVALAFDIGDIKRFRGAWEGLSAIAVRRGIPVLLVVVFSSIEEMGARFGELEEFRRGKGRNLAYTLRRGTHDRGGQDFAVRISKLCDVVAKRVVEHALPCETRGVGMGTLGLGELGAAPARCCLNCYVLLAGAPPRAAVVIPVFVSSAGG